MAVKSVSGKQLEIKLNKGNEMQEVEYGKTMRLYSFYRGDKFYDFKTERNYVVKDVRSPDVTLESEGVEYYFTTFNTVEVPFDDETGKPIFERYLNERYNYLRGV